ncbi:MAG TPA: intradiol ring-cleavage dioxygenase [Cyclobacteriaceae bacterium]|nr:intradiol ring-cleavage dioxygenase [Cyclobacteriaceae bacterium]
MDISSHADPLLAGIFVYLPVHLTTQKGCKSKKRMKRRDFFKKVALPPLLLGLGACSVKDDYSAYSTCFNTIREEEGPWPYPGGEANNPLNKSDITGGQPGIPLTLKIVVVNFSGHCAPVPDASVHIWHCNKDGYYSGYPNQSGANGTKDFSNENWLRGYQVSDANGVVNFKTIYPGWETGRTTHIHVEVFVKGTLIVTTQFAFPDKANDVVNASSQYSSRGANPTKNADDTVFNDSETHLALETLLLDGTVTSGFTGNYQLGLPL